MKCLLDSHVFLWAIQQPERLSSTARQAMVSSQYEVFVSAVAIWEISLKCARGKLTLMPVTPSDLPRMAVEHGYHLLPLNADIAATYHQLPLLATHKDPFDRMLVWQAIRTDMTLISRDGLMAAYQPYGVKLLW